MASSRNVNTCGRARKCTDDAPFASSAAASARKRLPPDQSMWQKSTVAIAHKTGVEMEALTGASIAALTVYDMCKALSHEIIIADVRLLEKSGGKRNVRKGRVVR